MAHPMPDEEGGEVNQIIHGDVPAALAAIPDGSVHVQVCSPPYWGLRAYAAVAPSIWGGRDGCEHQWSAAADRPGSEYREGQSTPTFAGRVDKEAIRTSFRRDLLGSESELDCLGWARGERCNACYICHLRAVFAEVWRVLHPSGTCWVNLGDSYGSTGSGTGTGNFIHKNDPLAWTPNHKAGIRSKCLALVPQRFALAMEADGWLVRNENIWWKPSCMPSSARDRFTVTHEQIWLLTKRESYFFDDIAIRESGACPEGMRAAKASPTRSTADGVNSRPPEVWEYTGSRHPRDVWRLKPEPCDWEYCAGCDSLFIGVDRKNIRVTDVGVDKDNAKLGAHASNGDSPGFIQKTKVRVCPHCGKSDAWVAHYAAFPSSLPRRCILAGTSEVGVCAKCLEPHVRITETVDPNGRLGKGYHNHVRDDEEGQRGVFPAEGRPEERTIGWRPGCSCSEAESPAPATVLDCFVGSGTSAIVAAQLGRNAIGIDASALYCKVARERVRVLGTRETKAPPVEAMPLFASKD